MFYQLDNELSTADELALDEDLREGGPVGIELEPLLDPLVLHDVEVAEFDFHLCQIFQEHLAGLALRLGGTASDENHDGVGAEDFFDLVVGAHSLVYEQLVVVFFLFIHKL